MEAANSSLRCLSSPAETKQTWQSVYSFSVAGIICRMAFKRFVSVFSASHYFSAVSNFFCLAMNHTHQIKPFSGFEINKTSLLIIPKCWVSS